MMQFLNNIWIAFSTENVELVNLLLIPATVVEHYLFMNIFLITFNIKTSTLKKFLYVILVSIASLLSLNFITSPFNIFINYACMIIFIKYIFGMNFLKSFLSLVTSVFTFGIINTLFQKLYLSTLKISPNIFINTPIYRISYLLTLYILVFVICITLKNIKKLHINLEFFDKLDKKTLILLYINLFIGFLTLCIQLITTAFYIDIVPIIINIFNFILLISFLLLSIYSFTRMIKLANTRKDLQSAEEYNKSLEILYDKVKGFQHDFNNIVSTIDGYIESKDIVGLQNYFVSVKKDCKITNNLSILNPRIINNPGIYSLLNNKYFKATKKDVSFNIEFFLDLKNLNVNFYELSRILGILIDNAIEEAEKCTEKIVQIIFRRENRNHKSLIIVKNTYLNKNVDIEKIFEKGISSKSNHSGIGLWEVRNYIAKSKNLDLFTTKNSQFFIQELSIFDY